jgi:hypothetical protein
MLLIKNFLDVKVFFHEKWSKMRKSREKQLFLKWNWPSIAFWYRKMFLLSKNMAPITPKFYKEFLTSIKLCAKWHLSSVQPSVQNFIIRNENRATSSLVNIRIFNRYKKIKKLLFGYDLRKIFIIFPWNSTEDEK